MKAFSLVGKCAEKSELVKRLIVELVRRGLTVSTIKRVSDAVDLERQGSGTWKHRAVSGIDPQFPTAPPHCNPLRDLAEAKGSTAFIALWARQTAKLRRKEPASDLIRKIAEARGLMSRLARA